MRFDRISQLTNISVDHTAQRISPDPDPKLERLIGFPLLGMITTHSFRSKALLLDKLVMLAFQSRTLRLTEYFKVTRRRKRSWV
jgi:hypothetical protein